MKKLILYTLMLCFTTPVLADVLVESPRKMLQEDLTMLWDESSVKICIVLALVVLIIGLLIWKRKNKYIKIVNRCLVCMFVVMSLFALFRLYSPEIYAIKHWINMSLCPSDKPLFDGTKCYSCDELGNIVGRDVNCEVCPNRVQQYECGPSCILRDAPGPNYIYVQCKGWGKKCGSGLQGRDGNCYTCSDVEAIRDKGYYDNGIEISEEDCLRCPNTQYIDGFGCAPACPVDRPLWVDGKCASCDLTKRSGYVRGGCDKCPNRFEYNEGCYQKCPEDKPVLDLWSGECFSCSYEGFIRPIEPSDDMVWGCLKCPNEIHNVRCMDIEEQNYQ